MTIGNTLESIENAIDGSRKPFAGAKTAPAAPANAALIAQAMIL
jgi:hypothetical protein